jgi:serine/threonine-protein kinase RsbW
MELTKTLGPKHSIADDRSARLAVELANAIKGGVAGGKEVTLAGFGSFGVATPEGTPAPAATKANVVGDICSKLGESNESRIKGVLDEVVEEMKKELLSGNRILLDDVGVLEVKSQRPQVERQPRGHRLIKPAMSTIVFTSNATVNTQAGAAKLAFAAAEDLRKRVEQFKESSIMLVVPERDFFTKTLEYYFESAGWDIEVCTQVSEALQKIESGKAYLVILDASMAEYQSFCYALKAKKETSSVPLIILYPGEDNYKVLPEVSIVGDQNLPQPFEFRQLLDLADGEIIRSAEEELIFHQQIHIHLPTDEQSIEKVIETVHKLLEASGLNEEGHVAMSAAFREAVVNAAQHGNKYKRDRKIEVQYLLDGEKITAVVKDQGNGFNHEQFVKSGSTKDAIQAARERHAQGRMGGLGIMLMLRCCDRLEYNKQGNQITLTKYLKLQN